MYFLTFLHIAILSADALFAVTYSLVEGGREVVFAQLPDDPNPVASDDVLGQGLASRPHISPPEMRKSLREPDPAKRAGWKCFSCGFGDELLRNGG